jgi:hypothetical protein
VELIVVDQIGRISRRLLCWALEGWELIKGPLILTVPFFLKRKTLEHELEIRALVFDLAIHNGTNRLGMFGVPSCGVAVRVDLDMLVEAIYVAPGAVSWFSARGGSVVARLGARFGSCSHHVPVDNRRGHLKRKYERASVHPIGNTTDSGISRSISLLTVST